MAVEVEDEELEGPGLDADGLDADGPVADGATPAKKRTRRGTRGGRRRRKPGTAGVATEGEADGEVVAERAETTLVAAAAIEPSEPTVNGSGSEQPTTPSRRRTSRIHVPGDADLEPATADVIPGAVTVDAAELAEPAVAEADGDADAGLEGDGGEPRSRAPGGDGPVVVKRKTRRGSRGGKNRRKKPAVVADAEADDDGAVAVATVVESSGDGRERG